MLSQTPSFLLDPCSTEPCPRKLFQFRALYPSSSKRQGFRSCFCQEFQNPNTSCQCRNNQLCRTQRQKRGRSNQKIAYSLLVSLGQQKTKIYVHFEKGISFEDLSCSFPLQNLLLELFVNLCKFRA